MMKIKQISNWLFLLAFSSTLYSCAGQAEDKAIATETNDGMMEESMEIVPLAQNAKISDLDNAQRSAFEAKAMQKLQDFFDYIKIISDPVVNADLRNHSFNLALELFASDTTTVTDSLLNKGEPMAIKDYLSGITIKKSKVAPKINAINVIDPLTVDSLGTCNGKLNAKFAMRKQQFDKTIEIHLIEIEKEFGQTNQKTIEVKLGNIY